MEGRPNDETSSDVVQLPQPAHLHDETDSDDELEATELRSIGDDTQATLPRLSHIISPGLPKFHWYDPVKKFWRHEVRISVPHDDCRDHLGKCSTGGSFTRQSTRARSILQIRPHTHEQGVARSH